MSQGLTLCVHACAGCEGCGCVNEYVFVDT
jgi:hypothetical protein